MTDWQSFSNWLPGHSANRVIPALSPSPAILSRSVLEVTLVLPSSQCCVKHRVPFLVRLALLS